MSWLSYDLSDSQRVHMEDAVHRLEQAWHAESQPDIALFLAGLDEATYSVALVECIKVDLEYHWRTTQPVFLESYLRRWPQLRNSRWCTLELLAAECSTRATFAMPVTIDELQRRFGDLAIELDLDSIARQASKDRISGSDEESMDKDGADISTVAAREGAPPIYLPLTMGQTFGRYKIRGQLGKGGEGNVYRAYDRKMDREVALKFPHHSDAEVFERFLRQSQVAARLEHRNICRVYDAGAVGGVHFIAMSLIRGTTIHEVLQQRGPFDCRDAATTVRAIADALGRVHEAGIVHRDIKSANVMIDQDGEPVLMDFGLARSIEKSFGITTTGAFVGTLAFMSPEVAGGRPADQLSDIYSLGVVLYQMLTGEVPFSVQPAELLKHLGKSPAPSPRKVRADVSPTLDGICRRAMAPRAEDRYPTADEFADALQRFLRDEPQKYKAPRRTPRKWLWLAVSAAAALVLFGCLVYFRGDKLDKSSDERPWQNAGGSEPAKPEPVARSVERWLDLPDISSSFAVTSDARQAFVADYGMDDTCVIHHLELATGKAVTDPITIASFPSHFDLALSPDDRRLYVTSYYSNELAEVDLEADRRVTRIPIVSPDKLRDASWWRWASHLRITPDGTKIVIPMGQDGWPDQEVDPADSNAPLSRRARVSNDQVSIVDISADHPHLIHEVPLGDEPAGGEFCISGDSRFAYLSTTPRPRSDTPKLYEVQLEPPYRVRTLEFPLATLDSVLISERLNRIYVCDRGHRRIWVVDRETFGTRAPVVSFDLNGRAPADIVLDDEQDLLAVLSTDSRSLHFVDAIDGRMLARFEQLKPAPTNVVFTPDRQSVIVRCCVPGALGVVPVPVFRRKIAFHSDRNSGTSQLYTMDVDGSNVVPVLARSSYANDVHPRWSPDGKRLAFISDRDIRPRVCVANVDDARVRMYEMSNPVIMPALGWSPDGERLLYVADGATELHAIHAMTGDVSNLDIQFPRPYQEIADACWASDGYVYATVMPIRDGTRTELFRVDPNDRSVTQLTDEAEVESSSRKIAVARDGRIAILRHLSARWFARGIWLLREGEETESAFELLTNGIPSIAEFSDCGWFPDGSSIAVSGYCGDDAFAHIWICELRSRKAAKIAAGPWSDWSPDVSVRLPDVSP